MILEGTVASAQDLSGRSMRTVSLEFGAATLMERVERLGPLRTVFKTCVLRTSATFPRRLRLRSGHATSRQAESEIPLRRPSLAAALINSCSTATPFPRHHSRSRARGWWWEAVRRWPLIELGLFAISVWLTKAPPFRLIRSC